MRSTCKACSRKIPIKSGTSWLSAILIVILPKCPFCVMAYSSAITMCGASSFYMADNNWVSYIPILLAALIIAFIALNYRGKRTLLSIIIALLGMLLIISAHQLIVASNFYMYGTYMLFLAIFLNGSMLSVLSYCKKLLLSIYIKFISEYHLFLRNLKSLNT